MRPPGPVPVTPARSTPFSNATRRAMGDAATSRTGGGACGPVAVAGAAAGAGAGAGAPAAGAAPAATWPSGLATSKVSPFGTEISARVPAAGEGTSRSTLSVETSTMISSCATASPTAFFHSTTVPSVTDSMSGNWIGTRVAGTSGAGEPLDPAPPGAAAAGALAPPEVISPSSCPTSTAAPGPAAIVASTPVAGEGISTSTLSVVTSRRVSPSLTASPTFLRHSITVPSVTDSPSTGRWI